MLSAAVGQSLAQPPDAAQDKFESPISVTADAADRWNDGAYEIWLLRGNCQVQQGASVVQGDQAVVWVELGRYGERQNHVIAYFEGNVAASDDTAKGSPAKLGSASWLGTFHSAVSPKVNIPNPGTEPSVKPAVYITGLARRDRARPGAIQQAQFTEPGAPEQIAAPPANSRRLRAFQRSNVPVNAKWWSNPDRNEGILVIDSGINLIIDGVEQLGSVDISADRMVIWTAGMQPDLTGEQAQTEETPLEIYMEGNLVFRQGDRVIYAERMYYNVNQRTGIILDAELLTPVAEYGGLVRLRSRILQQTGEGRFAAQDAFITSSRLGQPTYRLESSNVYFEDNQRPAFDPATGAPVIDPVTGEQVVDHDRLASSYGNVLRLGEFPIFYWPVLSSTLEEPSFYLESITFKNDKVFGTQIRTEFDLYQLLGVDQPPENTEWNLSLDYLSERGLGFGTNYLYAGESLFGVPGAYGGFIDAWAIQDQGLDRLGRGRQNLTPEEDFRYRLFGRHRQQLPDDWQLTAELGLISDRNFLEQYYENEWDEFKDQTTGVELKRTIENMSYGVTADFRVNDFFTETEWLPRLDHFWLGQPVFGETFTYFEHSQAAYARLRTASEPEDPKDAANFELLPWEADVEGERLITRQEIDLPFQVGPVKFVPYALGELGHWGEALDGDDLQRAYGQVGLRGSIPFWAANSNIESHLFNVHGLTHKVVFEAEYFMADASEDMEEFPMYEQLDDNNIEHFRRRTQFLTFDGPPLPNRFDERFYALRSGLGSQVTSPSAEIADDLSELRAGVRQRWQTKRGLPGQRRLIDWIVLDTQAVYFPNEDRDNFGEDFGLLEYDFRWHVGDRVTLLSDGSKDFFEDGQQVFTVGAVLTRPPRGSLFLGYRSLKGPFESEVVKASYSYRLSPKWVSVASATVDVAGDGNIGNYLGLTRVGESFLVSFGFNVDAGKENLGFSLAIEPRFIPSSTLGRAGGAQIPPAGALGLE